MASQKDVLTPSVSSRSAVTSDEKTNCECTAMQTQIGIARRRGLGKIRHLDVGDLWVQAKVRQKVVDLVK